MFSFYNHFVFQLVPYSDWAIFDSSFQLPPRVFGSCTVWMLFIFNTFCFKFWVLFKSTITCLTTTTSPYRSSPLTEPLNIPNSLFIIALMYTGLLQIHHHLTDQFFSFFQPHTSKSSPNYIQTHPSPMCP